MLKQATSEQLVDEMAAISTARLYCDQALSNTVKKLLANSTEIDQDAPEFSAAFADELITACQADQGPTPCFVGRFISGGLMAEFTYDGIERFSIVISTAQITKEICWQQHPASKKGTYL